MNKHTSVWCQPRSGSSAYCNHLKETRKVFTDSAQEFMSASQFWPMLQEPGTDSADNFKMSIESFPYDNELRIKLNHDAYKIYDNIKNTHNPKWLWTDWKLTDRGIKPYYTRNIPRHYLEDTFPSRPWAQEILTKSKVPEVIKLYNYDNFQFEDITYDTNHHLLIREPLDNALSQIVAYITMVWHQESNDENKVRIKETISFKPIQNEPHKKTPYQIAEYCFKSNIDMLEQLGDKVDVIVKYEDMKFKNNRYKKMHTLQEKLAVCSDLHFLDDMRNNYNKRLDSLL